MAKKVILITGAGSGFGRELALTLNDGFNVVYATDKNIDSLFALKEAGINTFKLDVTNESDINNIVKDMIENHHRIDVLINNAGYGEIGYVEHIDMNDHKEQFNINYFGPINIIQKVLPFMKNEHNGQIINIASVVANFSFKGFGAYSASKAALKSLSIALSQELEDSNIKVYIIEPDASSTNFAPYAKSRYIERYKKLDNYQLGGYEPVYLENTIVNFLDDSFSTKKGSKPSKTANLIVKLIESDSKGLVKQTNLISRFLSFCSKMFTARFMSKFAFWIANRSKSHESNQLFADKNDQNTTESIPVLNVFDNSDWD